MGIERDSVELRAAATRLAAETYFMAWALATYRSEFKLTEERLAKLLACHVGALTSLALCRSPRFEDDRVFQSDVQAISRYVGCDLTALMQVLRAVQALSTLKGFTGEHDDQLLKAARDKHVTEDEPDKPEPRKR